MSDASNAKRRADEGSVTPPGFTWSATIAVGRGAVSGISVSANGALLVVTHYGDDSFSLIDVNRRSVAETVIDVDEPFAVAMSEKSSGRAYISSASAGCDSVLAFDIDANQVVETYPLTGAITDLAISPNGRHVYAGRTGSAGADVAILDTVTGNEQSVSVAAAGTATQCVRLSPDGRYLYVAVSGVSTAELVVVDTRRNRVLSTVEIGSPIRDVALSPDGDTAFVGSSGPGFGTMLDVVDVRNARKCAVAATYKIGDTAGVLSRLTASRDGSRAYLVGDTGVTVLSTRTQEVVGNIVTGAPPSCVVESPAGTYLYVGDYAGSVTVLTVDAATTPAEPTSSEDAVTTAHRWAFADLRAPEPSPA